jgi:hypothetical protein
MRWIVGETLSARVAGRDKARQAGGREEGGRGARRKWWSKLQWGRRKGRIRREGAIYEEGKK